MSLHPLTKAGSPEDLTGTGIVTAAHVRARARELALLAGRPLGHVTPADFEQAKRELLGDTNRDSHDPFWESTP